MFLFVSVKCVRLVENFFSLLVTVIDELVGFQLTFACLPEVNGSQKQVKTGTRGYFRPKLSTPYSVYLTRDGSCVSGDICVN